MERGGPDVRRTGTTAVVRRHRAARPSSPPITIRPAEPCDWPSLWPLLRAMGGADSEAAARERLRQFSEQSDHYVPVAIAAGEVVGYAWVQDYGPHLRGGVRTARLHDLYVAPAWRRRGFGRRLFEAARAWGAGHSVRWLQWRASVAAVPFYERLGLAGDTKSDLEQHPFYEIEFAHVST